MYTLDDFAFQNFIARLHICKTGVIQNIRDQGKQFVAQIMPEEKCPMGALEPGTVHHVGVAVRDGLEELGVFLGMILEVGILENYNIAGDVFDAGAQLVGVSGSSVAQDAGSSSGIPRSECSYR